MGLRWWGRLRYWWNNEIGCRKSSWSNRSMSLKTYQTSKYCTVLYNIIRKDFTTLESYHGGSHFIFCHDDCKVNSRNMVFISQSNLLRMCACMYLLGSTLPKDVEVAAKVDWARFNDNVFCWNPLQWHSHCINRVSASQLLKTVAQSTFSNWNLTRP